MAKPIWSTNSGTMKWNYGTDNRKACQIANLEQPKDIQGMTRKVCEVVEDSYLNVMSM